MDPITVDLHFPRAGIDQSKAYGKQPARPVGGGRYARTTQVATNVRGLQFDTLRARGGSRPGLSKYVDTQVAGTEFVVQELAVFVGSGFDPPGAIMSQQSQSGRVVLLVAVAEGDVYVKAPPAGGGWTAASNVSGDTPPLNFSGIMYSANNNQKMYFADGVNFKKYDPHTNEVSDWAATAGSLPVDSEGNAPRLICTWRGRTVLSGLLLDPQNWFMSAVSDPTDFDYGAAGFPPTMAVAGNNSSLGLIGDVVTGLCPYSDDVLIFFGDHTIYMMRGDPMAGGSINLVSDAIGGAWGIPWTKDPAGAVYFVSNQTGIYSLVPGQVPQLISRAIDSLLRTTDTGENVLRLQWSEQERGLYLFITPAAEPSETLHYFWEPDTGGGWYQVAFGDTDFNPLCCCVLDGNEPTDRVALVGCWDGYVRFFDYTATTDDGVPIESEVWIGPILTTSMDEVRLDELQAVLGEASGDVTWGVVTGTTAEEALGNSPEVTGTWSGGRNLTEFVRRAGHAIYLRMTSTARWAMESVRARYTPLGKVRRRGR